MALKDQGLLISIICGAGLLAAGTLVVIAYREGPAVTSEVCTKCGLFRQRTVWRFPRTSMGVVWRSAFTNSLVSVAIHDHKLVSEWRHRWLVYSEIRPVPPTRPPVAQARSSGLLSGLVSKPKALPAPLRQPGVTLVYQYNSPDVAQWIISMHRLSDRPTFTKWMRWLADTNISPHLLGTAVRYRLQLDHLNTHQEFQAWLKSEEQKLVFGDRPKEE